uniref:LLP-B3 protein n=2 Tax=Lilium TaxID=4688 RepID=Q8GZS2_LILLO|nr:LLP-B3 protein [Lilium longiflorum]
MSKLYFLAFVAVASLSFRLSLADPNPTFIVEGRVYCDSCRAGFETNITTYIEGAKVKLECRHFDNDSIAHTVEGVTNSTGTYSIQLENDHESEICEVVLVSSPIFDCNEIDYDRDRARVTLTNNNGIDSPIRYANSLGFLQEQPDIICGDLLKAYGIADP